MASMSPESAVELTRPRKRKLDSELPEKPYTQGPMDSVFGQHRAFPVDSRDRTQITQDDIATDVNSYLASVRLEAETGEFVNFVDREIEDEDVPDEELIEETQGETEILWRSELLKSFISRKNQLPTSSKKSHLPETFAAWRQHILNTPPDMAVIMAYDHELVMKLIIYCTKWLSGKTNENLSKWCLGLLFRISNLLDKTDQSTVRDLGKKALKLHGHEETDTARMAHAVIIGLVGQYFGQRDLLV